MSPMKYRCWRNIDGDWKLAGYEMVMSGRWCTSETPDMADPREGTLTDVKRDQYTGRKDKDGREVYAGDILGPGHERLMHKPFLVIWSGKSNSFEAQTADEEPRVFATHNRRVIGTVFEHPEFLKHRVAR